MRMTVRGATQAPAGQRSLTRSRAVVSRAYGARIRRASAFAREILALHPDLLAPGVGPAAASAIELTSTGLAVVVLSPADAFQGGAPTGKRPCAVIKMPLTAEAQRGLERESAALAALHADSRLGRWGEFLPRPHVSGTLDGQAYRIDSGLDGCPAIRPLRAAETRRRVLGAAAEAIHFLHRATATTLRGGSDVAELWVDAHVRELSCHAGRRRPLAERLERLREELHAAVASPTFSAGWIHGDYWLGNILFTGRVQRPEALCGIVDWEAAAPRELPLHDTLHLLLFTRRLRSGRELGELVRHHLMGGEWPVEERGVLERHAAWGGWGSERRGALSERHALLLYWLRHVAMHARQQTRPVGYRYRLWERRNVLPVLACL